MLVSTAAEPCAVFDLSNPLQPAAVIATATSIAAIIPQQFGVFARTSTGLSLVSSLCVYYSRRRSVYNAHNSAASPPRLTRSIWRRTAPSGQIVSIHAFGQILRVFEG